MDRVLMEVIPYLPEKTADLIAAMPEERQEKIREIRINAENPTLLYTSSGRQVCYDAIHTKSEIEASFRKICSSSAYSHRNEIRAGFVTVPGGHRVGIVGTAVLGEDGRVEGMRDICGLSFRIAREYDVCLDMLLPQILQKDRLRNLMLLGPPCSGKTTVLRSLAKALSEEVQVSVIDEREELFPHTRAVPPGCDVLRGYPKALGILQALRTLSPRVVVCDEVGDAAEVSAMMNGLHGGVSLVVSAHAYSVEEFLRRPPVRELFFAGGIDIAVFLNRDPVGTVQQIVEREELRVKISDAGADISPLCGVRSNLLA